MGAVASREACDLPVLEKNGNRGFPGTSGCADRAVRKLNAGLKHVSTRSSTANDMLEASKCRAKDATMPETTVTKIDHHFAKITSHRRREGKKKETP